VVVSAVIVTTDLEAQDLKAITVAVNSFFYKKGGHFKNDRLFLCQVLSLFSSQVASVNFFPVYNRKK
jgi:hypothetical protein